MARTDQDALMLQMSADIRALEKQMKRAGQVVDDGAKKAERRFQAMNDNMGKATRSLSGAVDNLAGSLPVLGGGLSAVGPAGIAAAAAVAGFGIALNKAAEAAKRIADIDDAAIRLGLTAEALQELRHAGEATGVKLQDVDTALQGLNAAIGAIQTGVGAGRMKAVFAELGIPPEQLATIRSADELLPLVAERLRALGSAAAQTQLARKLGIEALLPLLREGASGVANLRAEARQLGLVLDNDTVKAVGELDERLRVVDERAAAASTRLSAEFIPALVWIKEKAADAAGALASMFAWMNRTSDSNPSFQIESRLKWAQKYRERANTIRTGSTLEAALASGAPGLRIMRDQNWREDYARAAEKQAAQIDREIEQISLQQVRAQEAAALAAQQAASGAVMAAGSTSGDNKVRAGRTGASGPTPEEVARTREIGALRERIELAQAAANEKNAQALQDQLDRLEKIAEYRKEGLGLAEATSKADSFIATRTLNREVAASRQTRPPAGLVSTSDSMRRMAEDLKGFTAEDEARLRDSFRYAFQDGVAAAINGGVGGLFELLGQRLAGRAIDQLADGLFGMLSRSGGGGLVKGIAGLIGFARGGEVRGPGSSTSDSVLARLSNGEFVVNASATRNNRGLLEAINSGQLPAFAGGGLVGRVPSLQIARSPTVTQVTVDLRGAVLWEGEYQRIMAQVDQRVVAGTVVGASAAHGQMRQDLQRRQRGALY